MSDFWSRRRAAVEAEQAQELERIEARAQAELETEQEAKSDEVLLQELSLPDPDSLAPGDDVAGFMAKDVPDRLRRRALRQLWKLNPVLANVDGLVDYGEDFTDAATVVENLQTAYQVGKGMLRHIEALAAQEVQNDEDDESDPDAPALDYATSEPQILAIDRRGEWPPVREDTLSREEAKSESDDRDIVYRPARMQFNYDESH